MLDATVQIDPVNPPAETGGRRLMRRRNPPEVRREQTLAGARAIAPLMVCEAFAHDDAPFARSIGCRCTPDGPDGQAVAQAIDGLLYARDLSRDEFDIVVVALLARDVGAEGIGARMRCPTTKVYSAWRRVQRGEHAAVFRKAADAVPVEVPA